MGLIPVDELTRLIAERRQPARARARAATPGRPAAIPADVVDRIRREHAAGATLAQIASDLNDIEFRNDAWTRRPLLTQWAVTMSSSIMGELVTETFNYDGGRQVTAYVPPLPPEAVVFAGDGQLITQWGGVLEVSDVPPTMIVGTDRLEDETLRLHEYSPVFDAERFAAHERFFVEDVRQWARSRLGVALPAERTAVFGVSASGELALAVGLRHPDLYGAVFCASPGGGYRPPAVMPNSLPRAYLVAGTLEPFFVENATRWAVALRDAGADVVMAERVGSHGDAFWREEFPLMVAWAFGR